MHGLCPRFAWNHRVKCRIGSDANRRQCSLKDSQKCLALPFPLCSRAKIASVKINFFKKIVDVRPCQFFVHIIKGVSNTRRKTRKNQIFNPYSTTLQPLCNHSATTLQPPCNHSATTLQPPCNHYATTLQPPPLSSPASLNLSLSLSFSAPSVIPVILLLLLLLPVSRSFFYCYCYFLSVSNEA